MNNRYLYRAKRIDNGKWVEGYYAYSGIVDRNYIITVRGTCALPPHNWIFDDIEIDKNTLCQYTGLTDKNGKLIWENDIVWDSEERKFYKIIFSQEDMCYYAQDADGYKHTFESCYGSSIDVESNIFDNPELLEN